jgi:hypothetical protein
MLELEVIYFDEVRVKVTGRQAPLSGVDGLNDEEQKLFEALGPAFEQERLRVAKMLANKPDEKLFGETEFELRDHLLHLGAQTLETAANERQKKGRLRGC